MGCSQSRCLSFYRISNRMRKRKLCQNVRNNRISPCPHCCQNYNTCFDRPIYSGLPSHHSHFPIQSHLPINCQKKCFHNHHPCPSTYRPNSMPISFNYKQECFPISNLFPPCNNGHLKRNHHHHSQPFANHSTYASPNPCLNHTRHESECLSESKLKFSQYLLTRCFNMLPAETKFK